MIDWLAETGKRASRAAILPIMKQAMGPVVAAEKSAVNSISGALSASLAARAGKGDFPGIISVESKPQATAKQAIRWWSRSPRAQHRKFAAQVAASGSKNYRIFYGDFVEGGHRQVRWHEGKLTEFSPRVDPHPFAGPAMESAGPAGAKEIEEAVSNLILGD